MIETTPCTGGDPPECCVPLNERRCPKCGSEWWMQTMKAPGEARCWEPDCEHIWTMED